MNFTTLNVWDNLNDAFFKSLFFECLNTVGIGPSICRAISSIVPLDTHTIAEAAYARVERDKWVYDELIAYDDLSDWYDALEKHFGEAFYMKVDTSFSNGCKLFQDAIDELPYKMKLHLSYFTD